MKSILIPLLLITCNSFSQITFKSDSVKNYFHPEIENQLFNNSPEFQFRVWIKYDTKKDEDLIVLSYNKSKWECKLFEYKYFGSYEQLVEVCEKNESCDSLLSVVIQNRIYDLPNMMELKDRLRMIDEYGNELVILFSGTNYSFEFVTLTKYKRINYQNPIAYHNKYKDVQELMYISNLVNFINRTFFQTMANTPSVPF